MRRGRAIGREFAGWIVCLSNRKCHHSRTDPFTLHPFMTPSLTPAMGKLSSAGSFLVLLFLLHIKSCLCLFFSCFRLCSIWLAFSGSAQGLQTWLNLLSVQP